MRFNKDKIIRIHPWNKIRPSRCERPNERITKFNICHRAINVKWNYFSLFDYVANKFFPTKNEIYSHCIGHKFHMWSERRTKFRLRQRGITNTQWEAYPILLFSLYRSLTKIKMSRDAVFKICHTRKLLVSLGFIDIFIDLSIHQSVIQGQHLVGLRQMLIIPRLLTGNMIWL